jgi:hypothetical protein
MSDHWFSLFPAKNLATGPDTQLITITCTDLKWNSSPSHVGHVFVATAFLRGYASAMWY